MQPKISKAQKRREKKEAEEKARQKREEEVQMRGGRDEGETREREGVAIKGMDW